MEPEVLYCDNHLLVLNKPAGLLTQPNESREDSLEAFGKRYLKNRFDKQGNVFLEVVHRLDRPVSGVVLCARTSKALSRLHQAQREGRFQKDYLALAQGELDRGELKTTLRHGSRRALVDPAGKPCHLKYIALKKTTDYTLLKISLMTGRYHQIRAQFAHAGHPLMGDRKYGSRSSHETLFLHHYSLSFPHPISSEELTFLAPLSSSWSFVLDASLKSRLFSEFY